MLARRDRTTTSERPLSTSPQPDERVGTKIGEYTVESVLGIGGMGQVFLAAGPDGTRVALKLVKANLARDKVFRSRFSREARVAQTVDHPSLVPVLATGEHEGLPYIAAKFVEGGTLGEKLARDGPLDVAAAVQVCEEVAGGLEALWAAGIFHRDIKPANVLLDSAGRAYITDFGLVKDVEGTVLTMPGQAIGSMDYIPPEQIRGEEVTAAADIYSLGCVLYECVCGRPPFGDRQGMRVLAAHLQDDPADPATLRPELTQEFSSALTLALKKEPGDRPETASAYAAALRNASQAGAPG